MKHALAILLTLIALPLPAQEPLFMQQAAEKLYEELRPEAILEDKEGFLWIGSSEGLFRYDGLQYEPFLMPDSLCNNEVTAIYEAEGGRLWVGYSDGRIFREQPGLQFSLWQPEEGLPAVPVTGIRQNEGGQLWIATYGEGLYSYHDNRMYNINTDDGLPGDDLYTLEIDEQGRAWVGTDGGVSICSMQGQEKHLQHLTRADGLPDEIVRDIVPAEAGKFWIGTYGGGVALYDPARKEFQPLHDQWPYQPINCLLYIEGQELWIGTEGDGLLRWDFRRRQTQALQQQPLQDGKISALHLDAEGNLWALHRSHGVFMANRRFELVDARLPDIQAVLETRGGQIYVGTQHGLYQYKPQPGQYVLIKSENILSLHEGPQGQLFIGTFGNGLFCYEPDTGKELHLTEQSGLSNGSILSIRGQGDTIWLATLGGVHSLRCALGSRHERTSVIQHFDEASEIGTNFIYTVFPDSRGRVWFGTDGEGLSVLENGQLHSYAVAGTIPIQAVYSIAEDREGHIWFSTARHGVFEFDGTQFRHLALQEGLRDLSITSIIADEKGNLLIVHPDGIDIVDPVTHHPVYYDEEAGLSGLEPNLNAVAKGSGGTIWLGMGNRLLRYTALPMELAPHPRTVIRQVSIFLEPVRHTGPARFSANENNLVFEYIGLWYSSPEKVSYRYKLQGFDLGWIQSGDTRAVYSNLPPGNYEFQVVATENGLFNGEPLASYAFTIRRPYWQQWWFVLLVLGLAFFVGYTLIRERDRRREREALLLREKVESQYEALKSQINPHFLFNSFNTLVSIIEENPDQGVQFVEKLSDFYRSILQYREQQLISLEEELRLVDAYVFLLKKRFGESLKLSVNIEETARLHVAPLALQMLVENAVKHNVIARSRPLSIWIEQRGEQLVVRNNVQPKRRKEPSTGFGLQNIVTRYRLLSDEQVLVVRKNGCFEVLLPALKNGRSS